MKLLITGGAGFIGSNFILYWLKHHTGDSILNVDALTYAGNLKNLDSVKHSSRYSFRKADITDLSQMTDAMKGMDIVVHFAAESHVDRSIRTPQLFVHTNVLGTQVLLDAAMSTGIKRFHHISTDEVFGTLKLGSNQKFTESTQYNPRSPYSASKAASDHLVRAYHYTYGLPVTISNCSNNFGPYQFPEKFIPLAITNLLENKDVPVYGNGLNVRDWLYVEDHCRAIDCIINNGRIGDTYTIGGLSEDLNNLTVIRKILTFMGKDESKIRFVTDRPGHDLRYAVDWSKINTELGWKPKYDFDTYLKQTIDWYTNNASWWKGVKSGEYRSYYLEQYGERS